MGRSKESQTRSRRPFRPRKFGNAKASGEILKVEQKYNKQRKPLFQKRQEAIHKLNKSKGVNFWAVAFANHPFLAPMMNDTEIVMMSHLTEIDVIEDDDI